MLWKRMIRHLYGWGAWSFPTPTNSTPYEYLSWPNQVAQFMSTLLTISESFFRLKERVLCRFLVIMITLIIVVTMQPLSHFPHLFPDRSWFSLKSCLCALPSCQSSSALPGCLTESLSSSSQLCPLIHFISSTLYTSGLTGPGLIKQSTRTHYKLNSALKTAGWFDLN